MSLTPPDLETSLRAALRDHATEVTTSGDVYDAARDRALRIRRRRRTGVGASVAIAVAAVAVALPLSLHPAAGHDSVAPAGLGSPGATAPTAPAVSPSAASVSPTSPSTTQLPSSVVSTPPRTLVSATADSISWQFRGNAALSSTLFAGAKTAYLAAHAGASITPLWAGTAPQGGWSALIFRAGGAGPEARIGAWIAHPDGSDGTLTRDDILVPGTTVIDQQIPGDPSNTLVVLAAPDVTKISYTPTGDNPTDEPVTDGVAVFGLSASGAGQGIGYIDAGDPGGAATQAQPLSAGGFLLQGNASIHSVRELVANGLYQAWLAGDRVLAAKFATTAAITELFATSPAAHFYVGGDCTDGAAPAQCFFAGRALQDEPMMTFVINGGASAGYRVESVSRATE
jgi:hypothetical protein